MMKILISLIVLLITVLIGNICFADEIVDLKPDWIPFIQQSDEGGKLVNPSISPADTTWLSYEVLDGDEIRLGIYNTITKDRFKLESRSISASSEEGTGIKPQDKQLSWRPTPDADGSVWAAFVGNGSGKPDLYLYNVSKKKCYLLQGSKDIDQGKGNKSWPAWSPDGKILAYCTDFNGKTDIYQIRGMDLVLKDPAHKNVPLWHEPLLTKSGNKVSPVWYPVSKSGMIAYTYVDSSMRSSIWLYDPKTKIDQQLEVTNADLEYFGASFDPTGAMLSFYMAKRGEAYLEDQKAGETFNFSVGLAKVMYEESRDSFSVSQILGGRAMTETAVIDVGSNTELSRGPAWLPNGRYLLLSMLDPNLQNPFRIIDTKAWEEGYPQSEVRSDFAKKDDFKFPSDITIVKHNLAYSYRSKQTRNLLIGYLDLKDTTATPWPAISRGRVNWYPPYANRQRCGPFCWLWQPWFSPDVGLNKRFLTAPLGWCLCCFVFKSCGCGKSEIVEFDKWLPPLVTKNRTAKLNFGLEVRF